MRVHVGWVGILLIVAGFLSYRHHKTTGSWY